MAGCHDDALRECIKKEMRAYKNASIRYTEAQRRDALNGLCENLRPRTVLVQGGLAQSASSPLLQTVGKRPGTMQGSTLREGHSVRVAGLRSRSEFNGTLGQVVSDAADEHGQLLVRLFPEPVALSATTGGKLVRVSRSKLSLEANPKETMAASRRMEMQWGQTSQPSFRRKKHGGFYSEGTSDQMWGDYQGKWPDA
eukprot:TRINITY_DN22649_c0_g2_i2.p1 TRINITY_DN22649_c0_g2~~TRINITY_DN22649_c0_g2_i2.p1  ORF type:complete len:197 (+),score=30.66 TRINITY_DN22649_c0_g2_i2:23-613(+)